MTGKLINRLHLFDESDCYADLSPRKKFFFQVCFFLFLAGSFFAIKKTYECLANVIACFFEDNPGRYRYAITSLLLTMELFGYGCQFFAINERLAHFFRPSIRLSQEEVTKNMDEMQVSYANKLRESNEAKRVKFEQKLQITPYYP